MRSMVNKFEDSVCAHCFSQMSTDKPPTHDHWELQLKISQALVMRTLYLNIIKFIRATNEKQSDNIRIIAQELAMNLIQIKYEVPFLDLKDTASSDFD